jgi:UDP-glucose 4-epimerase
MKINGLGTLRLLDVAVTAGVKRFIYFSTAHVYGAPLRGCIDESLIPRPIHPYAISHKVAEDFVLAAHDLKRIEGVVIRLSNGFGAPMTPDINRWTLLVNDLCRQAATLGKVTLNSAGTQLRDFIPLDDVERAVVHLLSMDSQLLGDGLFNLGSSKSLSILEMTQRVLERWRALTGHEITVSRPSAVDVEPAPLNYISEKLFATGFVPRAQIDQEIDDTLNLCVKAFSR